MDYMACLMTALINQAVYNIEHYISDQDLAKFNQQLTGMTHNIRDHCGQLNCMLCNVVDFPHTASTLAQVPTTRSSRRPNAMMLQATTASPKTQLKTQHADTCAPGSQRPRRRARVPTVGSAFATPMDIAIFPKV